MRLGAKIFGTLAGILILYLLLGILLPGSWEAETEADLTPPPGLVFPYLSRTAEWARWNPMPESGMEFQGPQEGVGAGIRWDDPQYGKGIFRIEVSEPPRRLEYSVEIEGGALRIRGVIRLSPEGGGSRLIWLETGDFGWNPLMGYAARGMARSQAEAMRSGLETLERILATEAAR